MITKNLRMTYESWKVLENMSWKIKGTQQYKNYEIFMQSLFELIKTNPKFKQLVIQETNQIIEENNQEQQQ